MKINTTEPPLQVKVSEDFESMDFGIKTCDIGFIISLLRNDMYRYPIEAICREVASNARDANREVGKGKIPIKIAKNTNPFLNDQLTINFIDEGPGISPERMREVFLNYGASTKRDTNEQTGGFGLGAKTPFAYTDVFNIETSYNNKKYIYTALIKDGNKGKMYLLSELDDPGNSGTTISVPIKDTDARSFESAVYRSTYLWDVRPQYINFTEIAECNEYSVVYENKELLLVSEKVKASSINFCKNSRVAALLDGIPYEIDRTVANVGDLDRFFSNISSSDKFIFFIKMPVGGISISPNRENLQYNKKSIKKLDGFLDTLKKLVAKKQEFIVKKLKNDLEKFLLIESLAEYRTTYRPDPLEFLSDINSNLSHKDLFFLTLSSILKQNPTQSIKSSFEDGNFLSLFREVKRKFHFEVIITKDEESPRRRSCHYLRALNPKRIIYLEDCAKKNIRKDKAIIRSNPGIITYFMRPHNAYFRFLKDGMEADRPSYDTVIAIVEKLDKIGFNLKSYKEVKPLKSDTKVNRIDFIPVKIIRSQEYSQTYQIDPKNPSNFLKRVLVEDLVYCTTTDLRSTKDITGSPNFLKFLIINALRDTHKVILVTNIKNIGIMVNLKIESYHTYLDSISNKEKETIQKISVGKALSNECTPISELIDINFKFPRYSQTISEIKGMVRACKKAKMEIIKNIKVLQINNDPIVHGDKEEYLKVVTEILDRFPLLTTCYGAQLEHKQQYVTVLEEHLIKTGILA